METILPYHNYIVVTPKGDIEGFQNEDEAGAYVLGYLMERIDFIGNDTDYVYTDNLIEVSENIVNVSRELSVYEGECRIYDLDSLIENIRFSDIFQDEKDEIISKLMEEDIDINTNDYQLDQFLTSTKQIERNA